MAEFVPRFRLYDSTGVSLIYEFTEVVNLPDSDHQDPVSFFEHVGVRGQGSQVSEGSQEPWDLTLEFVLLGDNYTAVRNAMNTVKTTVVKFTKYILKIDIDASTTDDYKVMRLTSIDFPIDSNNKRRTLQRAFLTMRVDAWA